MKLKNCIKIFLCGITIITISSCTADKTSYSPDIQAGNEGGPETAQAISPEEISRAMFIPGTAIVTFSEEMTRKIEDGLKSGNVATKAAGLDGISEKLGIKRLERVFPYAGEFEERTRKEGMHRFYYVEFDSGISLDDAREFFESIEGVESFEGQRRCTCLNVNDPDFSKTWGLDWNSNPSTDINLEEIWNYTMGDPNVKVCIVDQGVQLDHPDLAWNVSETDNYNFVKRNSTIIPGDHGTHVAGTIAAVGNNNIGVAGIAGGNWVAKKRGITMMSAQVFNGDSSASNFGEAIKWSADNGAVISQNSWGYDFDYDHDGKLSQSEKDAAMSASIDRALASACNYFIKYAGCDANGEQLPTSPMKGGLVVFAAGNDGIENGAPANYEPLFSVGAINKNGTLASFSDYGEWVDICAPGSNIYSTLSGSKYGSLSGTSMACPHVSGAAALLLSFFGRQGFTNADLEEILIQGSNPQLIVYGSRTAGPYLDVEGSFLYGISKYKRENNQDPVIETEQEGNLVFRQWQEISIPFKIYDPDGDNVKIETNIEGRAQFVKDESVDSLYRFTLLCELVSDFSPKKVTITAKDMFGGETVKEFTYQVLENQAPVSLKSLPDKLFTTGDNEVSADVSGFFSDPDEESLKYSVSSSNAKAVNATIEGSDVKIQPVGSGLSTVTVTATDHMGKKASSTFKVLVREPGRKYEVYPNPVVSILHIRTGIEEEDVKATLTTSNGAVAYEGNVKCSAFAPGEIDMTSFAPGQYKLTIKTGGETFENTIIKK